MIVDELVSFAFNEYYESDCDVPYTFESDLPAPPIQTPAPEPS
jgi:hypothetical protein